MRANGKTDWSVWIRILIGAFMAVCILNIGRRGPRPRFGVREQYRPEVKLRADLMSSEQVRTAPARDLHQMIAAEFRLAQHLPSPDRKGRGGCVRRMTELRAMLCTFAGSRSRADERAACKAYIDKTDDLCRKAKHLIQAANTGTGANVGRGNLARHDACR